MSESLVALVDRLRVFLPRFGLALMIALGGWVGACLLRQLIIHLLQAIRVDRLAEKAKLSELLRQGSVRLTFVELLGELAYWLVMIATTIVGLQLIGVTAAEQWLERFGYFIPQVLLSILILLFGMLLASFFGAAIRAASLNAGFPHGYLLGQVTYGTIVLVTIIVALEQLHVVTRTIEIALYIALGSIGLACALAIGLGAQEIVRRYLFELWERWKSSPR